MIVTFFRLPSVNAHRNRRLFPSLFALLACAACGSTAAPASSDNGAFPVRTSQSNLTADAWQALLATDTALGTLAKAQTQPLQVAGTIVAADGTTLTWAEFAPADNAPRDQVSVVFRSCPKVDGDAQPACVRGKGAYTATGVTLTDDAGKPLTSVPMGAPQAWEWETSTNLDNDNATIVAGLSGDSAPLDPPTVLAQFGAILQQKRRFIVLSSFGTQTGVDVHDIAAAAQASGRFDTVETIEYVRRTDIETLLPSLTALDVVVWVGSGVQQKPSKSSPPSKAIGMNVTRGIFGDEVYYGKAASTLLDAPPLGGPGLIVLAGQNTFLGDVNDKSSLAAALYEPGSRPIVGFSAPLGTPGPSGYTHLAIRDVVAATTTLVKALGSGANLDDAMSQAGSDGFKLMSPMAAENRKKWTWTAPTAGFWAKPPTTGTLVLKMNLTPTCVQPVDTCDLAGWKGGKKASGILNGSIKLQCDNPTFVGPYFTCTDGVTQPPGTKLSVTGIMRGVNAEDHILFLVKAEDGGPLGGILITGDGVLSKEGIDVGGGTTDYRFGGMAVASPYTDAAGNCCVTYPPQLSGTDASDLCSLQLHN